MHHETASLTVHPVHTMFVSYASARWALFALLARSEFMGKTFQAAQLTHERFLTIDHSCKIFFWYLPNWTSTDLWCVVLYVTYCTTHQRSVEVQLGRYQKNILQEWSMVKNLSCVSCAVWNVFPINSLLTPPKLYISKRNKYELCRKTCQAQFDPWHKVGRKPEIQLKSNKAYQHLKHTSLKNLSILLFDDCPIRSFSEFRGSEQEK